jgi:DNA-binding NarL/FixJ family response regulator
MFKVIVGDSVPMFRAGLAGALSSRSDFQVVQQCAHWNALCDAVARHPSALIIASTRIVDSLSNLLLMAQRKNSRVLLVVEDTESYLRYSGAGVKGVLRRSAETADFLNHSRNLQSEIRFAPPTIADPIKRDTVGTTAVRRLTRTQLRVVSLIMEGMKNRAIAKALGTSEQVVKNNLRSIFDKLGVSDRLELAIYTMHHPAVQMAAADAVAGFDLTQGNLPVRARGRTTAPEGWVHTSRRRVVLSTFGSTNGGAPACPAQA